MKLLSVRSGHENPVVGYESPLYISLGGGVVKQRGRRMSWGSGG
ncbi:MAG TPA: hypothetical protein VL096_13600 [Pirellulaceae bacterium]|nr:hypothetical protein [Pirellulaceae bacterium]